MAIQSTQCAAEELAELEEWLQSKGLEHVEKGDDELQAGEYIKRLVEPKGSTENVSPVWTVTWHPTEG